MLISVEGIDKTIDRIKAYEDAGADIIFPEAMKDEKEFEKLEKIQKYLLANMTEFGKSKLLSANELENLGYNIVIYPVTTQRLAMKNVEDGLRSFLRMDIKIILSIKCKLEKDFMNWLNMKNIIHQTKKLLILKQMDMSNL